MHRALLKLLDLVGALLVLRFLCVVPECQMPCQN
jgi:hypothetical protein